MKRIFELINKYTLNLIFLVSAFGTLTSLYFSEFMNLPPCDLCWYQRIFFYPILIISFISITVKDKTQRPFQYIFPLAVIGFPISIYHHLLKVTDLFPKETPFCNEAGACSEVEWELITGSGITIPFLCALGFGGILVISGVKLLWQRD